MRLEKIVFLFAIECYVSHANLAKFSCLSAIQKETYATNLTIEQFAHQLGLSVEYENGGNILRLVDAKGEEMAYLEIRLENKHHLKAPGFLFIKFRRVSEKIKDNKVGLSLFNYATSKYPNAEGVYAVMAADNKVAIEKGLAAGKSLFESIKDSPFYKGMSKLGFSEISEQSTEATIYLTHAMKPLKTQGPPQQLEFPIE